jgi:hypothetical protein
MWAKIFTNGNVYLIEEPGSKAVAMKESFRETVKLADALNWAKAQGAGMFAFAPAGETEPLIAPKPVEKPYLKLTRVGRRDSDGLEVLKLELVGTGKSWNTRSGAGGRQDFQKGSPSNTPGRLQPCPQGTYTVAGIDDKDESGDLICWAGSKDNYSASFGAGLGPVFVPFEPQFNTPRGDFGLHLDSNHDTSPGSAGCCVFWPLSDLKDFVASIRQHKPIKMVVDWGL